MTTEERTNEKRYLTTKEFKRKVVNLGFVVVEDSLVGEICVYEFEVNNTMQNLLARISPDEIFASTTLMFNFTLLKDDLKEKLFNLVNDYASTPLEEREEQERFFLKFKIEIGGKYEYLNYYKKEDELTLDNSIETSSFQTLFTDKELEKLKEKFGVTLSDFEKVPFKDKEKEEC